MICWGISKVKHKVLILIYMINIILIYVSGTEKGRTAFFTVPLVILLNISFSFYGFYKKNSKIGVTAFLLIFITPVLIFIVFINVFPFLTR